MMKFGHLRRAAASAIRREHAINHSLVEIPLGAKQAPERPVACTRCASWTSGCTCAAR